MLTEAHTDFHVVCVLVLCILTVIVIFQRMAVTLNTSFIEISPVVLSLLNVFHEETGIVLLIGAKCLQFCCIYTRKISQHKV